MKNKKGQVGLWIVGAIIVIAVLAVLGVTLNVLNKVGSGEETITLNKCDIAPTLAPNIVNTHKSGTSVAETLQARVNDAFSGTVTSATTYALGDKVQLFANASNFIDEVLGEQTLEQCGVNTWKGDLTLSATSAASMAMYNSDDNPLTDDLIGLNNQSQFSTTKSVKLRLNPATDEDTGRIIVVVDGNNTNRVGTVTMTGPGGTLALAPLPKAHTVLNTLSQRDSFYIESIIDGATQDYFISITPETSTTVNATAFNVTTYGLQDYVDDDGTFKKASVEGRTEDSDGTNTYEWINSFAFVVTSGA